MKSWVIFKHAIRQLTGNWRAVCQIALPAIIISFAMDAFVSRDVLFLSVHEIQEQLQAIISTYHGEKLVEIYTVAFLKAILALWVAVAWHRYVLLNEVPNTIPKFRGVRMLMYFLKGLLILLPVFLALVMILSPLIFTSAFLNPNGTTPAAFVVILGLCVLIASFLVIMRLSTLLPGAALGHPLSMIETWRRTEGQTSVFAGLSLLIVVLTMVISLGRFVTAYMPLIAALGFQTIAIYLQTLVFLSVLTTLYGHYIEKRPLVT